MSLEEASYFSPVIYDRGADRAESIFESRKRKKPGTGKFPAFFAGKSQFAAACATLNFNSSKLGVNGASEALTAATAT